MQYLTDDEILILSRKIEEGEKLQNSELIRLMDALITNKGIVCGQQRSGENSGIG